MKVAYNSCYGGFSISLKAFNRLVELGHLGALMYKESRSINDNCIYFDHKYTKRHNPLLIQIIEELGKEANGDCSNIKIKEVDDQDHYKITEYDGWEKVIVMPLSCDCH